MQQHPPIPPGCEFFVTDCGEVRFESSGVIVCRVVLSNDNGYNHHYCSADAQLIAAVAYFAWKEVTWRDLDADTCHEIASVWSCLQWRSYATIRNDVYADQLLEEKAKSCAEQWRKWGRGEPWK